MRGAFFEYFALKFLLISVYQAASVYQWLLSDGELESVWLAIEAHLLTVAVPPDLQVAKAFFLNKKYTHVCPSQLPEDASDVSDDARVAAAIAATAAGERVLFLFSLSLCVCVFMRTRDSPGQAS